MQMLMWNVFFLLPWQLLGDEDEGGSGEAGGSERKAARPKNELLQKLLSEEDSSSQRAVSTSISSRVFGTRVGCHVCRQ